MMNNQPNNYNRIVAALTPGMHTLHKRKADDYEVHAFLKENAKALGVSYEEVLAVCQYRGEELVREGRLLEEIGKLVIEHAIEHGDDVPYGAAELRADLPIIQEQIPAAVRTLNAHHQR
jgi:hypothetical protein